MSSRVAGNFDSGGQSTTKSQHIAPCF